MSSHPQSLIPSTAVYEVVALDGVHLMSLLKEISQAGYYFCKRSCSKPGISGRDAHAHPDLFDVRRHIPRPPPGGWKKGATPSAKKPASIITKSNRARE